MKKINVSWPAKFAILDHYSPSDSQACEVFSVTQDELDTARGLRAVGTLTSDRHFDVAKYSTLFASANNPGKSTAAQPFVIHPQSSKGDVAMSKPASTATTHTTAVDSTATTHAMPETATKKVKEPQKRGRKGNKIQLALEAIPLTPISVDAFIAQYGVSLAVLRQSKRFIAKLDTATQASIGTINVRQDKTTKQLQIWREMKN